jgi:hypothetical protein
MDTRTFALWRLRSFFLTFPFGLTVSLTEPEDADTLARGERD